MASALSGCALDNETARWVADLPDVLAKKLAAVGLIPKPAEPAEESLGPFLDAYIANKNFGADNTRRNYNVSRKHLINYFGRDKMLAEISPGDADEWRESLLRDYSAATVAREVKRARQFLRAAVRKRLIEENPFADLPAPAQINTSREFFVTLDVTEKLIDACPDAEWRLIIALSRYGGLRCPSEHLSLRLGDVDWEHNRVTVRSPKTAHHPGGESRVIPLFPELRPHLEAVFDQAEPGTEFVITRYRNKKSYLRTQFLRIIKRAGEEPWPKPFQNLRASRQTELTATFPLHVVCRWIGNSALIADKHYLQVTDDHYKMATAPLVGFQRGTESGTASVPRDQKAAQNPAQQPAAQSGIDSQDMNKALKNR